MDKEGPLSVSDSDSSSGLPELFPIHTFDIAKLKRNEIVWAEYKDLYWPAIVRDVDKKNKKVKVWYLDSPGKLFKVPFKKIHDFVDSDFSKKVEDDAKKHPQSKKFLEVLRRAHIFMYRQFQGKGDDPLEFFDLSKPYFLLKKLNSETSDIKVSSVVVSTENVGDKNDNLKENTEGESLVHSDAEGCTSTKVLSELDEEDSPYDEEMVDKILACITSGHIDNYLIDIVNSKISNERHKLYFEAVKKGQIDLFVESQPSVPIKSQKLHGVSIYLHSLYKQKIKGLKLNKLNEYIVSVWLPEAVNKAISLIETESLKLSDSLCGNNKSSSSLESETSGLTFNSGSNKFSSSSTEVEVLESLVDSGSNIISSAFQVELSESPIDSSCSNVLVTPKRKHNLSSSFVENHISNELKIETCSPRKKKFAGRKRQKRSSKTLNHGKTTAKKMDKPPVGSFSKIKTRQKTKQHL